MGNVYIPFKAILEDVGAEVVVPPKCSKRTYEIGIEMSPEHMCLPFKINMGNYIESIEQGAKAFFMIASVSGKCRLGTYYDLQDKILKDYGYDILMIPMKPLNSPKEIKDFLEKVEYVSGNKNKLKLLIALIKGLHILFKIDKLDQQANSLRPKEIKKGITNTIYKQMEEEILQSKGSKETLRIIKKTKKRLEKIEIDENKEVIKIAIVGEIYTILEQYSNLFTEKKLGEMGVEVHKLMTTSEFIKKHLEFLPFIKSQDKKIKRFARPYFDYNIGGHGLETVGTTLLYHKKKFDGIIHIFPFGCMPEIVAKGILEEIERDKKIPILTLIFDEMTGEAGYITRMEAFIDLIKSRKVGLENDERLSWG
jgi:predicted nucleotide-binding protein (sugar kinase/HSP70/actin superfamily)